MKYTKPHLSPELRAQITPHSRKDVRYASAGVFFLLVSAGLFYNLWPKHSSSLNNNNATNTLTQSEKMVLGATTEQTTTVETSEPQFTEYQVKNGDTLFNISQKYNVRWDSISQINNLSEPYLLHAGMTLKIPQATTSKVPDKIYTIKTGETLVSIAKQFNITVDDIIAVNPNLQKSDLITVGQVIKLP
jgi:LysM repeat protein